MLVAEQPSGGGVGGRKKGVGKGGEREGGVKGVVTRVGRGMVGVAMEERDGGAGGGAGAGGKEEGEGLAGVLGGEKRVWIVKVADDVTFKR